MSLLKAFMIFSALFTPLLVHATFPIFCDGRTEITYIPNSNESDKKIICYAPIEIDWDTGELDCKRTAEKNEPQIQMVEGQRQLFADHLKILFQKEKKRLKIKSLQFLGHVKVIQKNEEPDANSSHHEYLFADQLEYVGDHQQLLLSSLPGKQVYYYDELNHYEMNANQIKISKNPLTQKYQARGMGAVRFSFEESTLDKHFLPLSKDAL